MIIRLNFTTDNYNKKDLNSSVRRYLAERQSTDTAVKCTLMKKYSKYTRVLAP